MEKLNSYHQIKNPDTPPGSCMAAEAVISGTLRTIGMLILRLPYAPMVDALVGVTAASAAYELLKEATVKRELKSKKSGLD